ncbi:radical SAM family heme chaperone HemW [Oscillospiraceae bacterium MB08-C2-2]|nr:radical SAM family heme chaperone HemW [Oscillospiraceae bacterium MB08-C2-2]
MNRPVGLYLHIPFCLSKCPYCDFYSVPFTPELADAYLAAVLRAIDAWPGQERADTLYLGGGTPSLMGPERLGAVVEAVSKRFGLQEQDEITLEANPGSLELATLKAFRQAGFNRLSLGVQSLNDRELALLGRRHSAKEALEAIDWALEAGFPQISADLMLGIPEQTPSTLATSMDGLARSGVCHISAYLLKIEEGTPFFSQNKAALCPDEDQTAQLYLDCCEGLEAQGFGRYEISNFARNGLVAKHNLKYWECVPYLGIGPGAHSFMNGQRFYFGRDLQGFLQALNPWALTTADGTGGDWEEYAMLRLRLASGLDLAELERLYAMDTQPILKRAEPLIQAGLVTCENRRLALTHAGCLLSNAITTKLLS